MVLPQGYQACRGCCCNLLHVPPNSGPGDPLPLSDLHNSCCPAAICYQATITLHYSISNTAACSVTANSHLLRHGWDMIWDGPGSSSIVSTTQLALNSTPWHSMTVITLFGGLPACLQQLSCVLAATPGASAGAAVGKHIGPATCSCATKSGPGTHHTIVLILSAVRGLARDSTWACCPSRNVDQGPCSRTCLRTRTIWACCYANNNKTCVCLQSKNGRPSRATGMQ